MPETPQIKATYSPVVWRLPLALGDRSRDESTITGQLPDPASVHVYKTRLDDWQGYAAELRSCLSDRERARVERLKVSEAAERYVISRGLLRQLLAIYTGRKASDIHFRLGKLGKPYLDTNKDNTGLCFNNSDCGSHALYAFSVGRELGIDLERLPREVRAERIASRRFTAAEARTIEQCATMERTRVFLGMWTRKEAWGKALGVGIRYPMDSIDLGSQPHLDELELEREGRRWKLVQFAPDEQAIGCVIAEGTDWKLDCWNLQPGMIDLT